VRAKARSRGAIELSQQVGGLVGGSDGLLVIVNPVVVMTGVRDGGGKGSDKADDRTRLSGGGVLAHRIECPDFSLRESEADGYLSGKAGAKHVLQKGRPRGTQNGHQLKALLAFSKR
jgi:hypothetical protein